MIRVLFVCLGNICRSPMAEGIMRHLVEQRKLSHAIEVDSAGTSHYHIGDEPHHGTLRILRHNGIGLSHRGRQFGKVDQQNFDYLIAMDTQNRRDMQAVLGANEAEVRLILDYIPDGIKGRDVPDPWYTGNFEEVYAMLNEACNALLDEIVATIKA